MNWRVLLANVGAIVLLWSLLEMLYFGAIKPDGTCAGSQFETASACYNTWGYTIVGAFLGLTALLVGLMSSPHVGRGFQACLSALFSLAVVPFVLAIVYFNVQTAQDTQYLLQFPSLNYRIVFVLELMSLVGILLFGLVYWTYRYTRRTVHEVLQANPPKQIAWAGEIPEESAEE